jgi:uncharacterized protein YceK
MTTHRVTKVLLVFMWLCVLLLSGCAKFIKPDIGSIARPEARIDLTEKGVQHAAWITKDLVLTYSYSESGNVFDLSGKLVFDRSLTDSFGVINRFIFKMSFLDNEGRVLETVDITPLFSSYGAVPDQMTIKASCVRPEGARSIAFNYFGVFRGSGEEMGSAEWNISYFPFD